MTQPRHRRRSAFTLIETLIVVVLLGILASIVVPRLTNARDQTAETAVRRELQIIRHQIELFRNREGGDPDLNNAQWDELVLAGSEYLHSPPENAFNNLSLVVNDAAAEGPAGWVWRDGGNGTFEIYATNETGLAEWAE
ncbi:MAG: type II secretion system protein [Planctomycetota bacterium]